MRASCRSSPPSDLRLIGYLIPRRAARRGAGQVGCKAPVTASFQLGRAAHTSRFPTRGRTPSCRFSIFSLGRSLLLRPSVWERFISPGRTGHPPRRPLSASTRGASLGWSLVLSGDFGNEMDLNVTRFSKDSARRRGEALSKASEVFEKPPPQGPPHQGEPRNIIGRRSPIVLACGTDFFSPRSRQEGCNPIASWRR
jgi:hypothetical protein